MLALLLKAVPYRDWLYAAIAIAAVIFYNVHVHGLEVAYAAKQTQAIEEAVDAATARALSAAKKTLDAKDKQYAQDLAEVKANYEKLIADGDAAHAADVARLRALADKGSGNTNPVLAGAGGTGTTGNGGTEGPGGLGKVPADLGLELVDALRQDDAALTQCYAERDSLTGK